MGLNLKNVPVGKSTLKVYWALDEEGMLAHTIEPENAVFSLNLRYVSPRELGEIMADSYTRKVSNPKKRTKGKEFDFAKSRRDICRAAIEGWDLDVKAARLLHARLDLSKQKPTEKVDFTTVNTDLMAEHSDLGEAVNQCLIDYDFWFPGAEEQVGNLPSGPGGSTAGQPAAPASTPT